jgi:hypothetical protein
MELNPSRGAASCAATKEFPCILWHPKMHCLVHRSPPLVRWTNPTHATPSYLTKILLILSTHLRLDFLMVSSGFPTNNLYAFLFCPSHRPWLFQDENSVLFKGCYQKLRNLEHRLLFHRYSFWSTYFRTVYGCYPSAVCGKVCKITLYRSIGLW